MSRIGNKTITLPAKVKLIVSDRGEIEVEGPKGKLQWNLPRDISLDVSADTVKVSRKKETRPLRALHGLSRSLVANMVIGVSEGFTRELEIHGVGFKALVQGKDLNLSLGYSHPVLFPIPEGVKVTVTENTKIKLEGIDKQLVGQAAADIRAYYPPEPYKGKGVRYVGEHVVRKEGKTVQ